MYQPKPEFPPLFPNVGWWRQYMEALLAGMKPLEAVEFANSDMRARDWMRFSGVSVPVEGGGSALKNRPPWSWRLSEKALAQARKMDSTLATVYGATPFYRLLDHIISMREILMGRVMAADVCREAFRRVEGILGLDRADVIESARGFKPSPVPRVENEEEILTLLFLKGPEAIFQLLPTFNLRPK